MSTLVTVVGLSVGAWALLAVVGAAVLIHVPPPVRDALWPATPLVGFAAMALGLSWVGLILPLGAAVWLILALALCMGVWGWRRSASPLPPSGVWRFTLASWLVSAIPLAIAVGPLALTKSLLTRVTLNNDAFHYVSVITWLQGHRIVDVPVVTPFLAGDPVAYGPAVSQDLFQLRIGSELVQAGLNSVFTTQPQTSWYTWMALAAPMSVVASVSALRLLGASRVAAALAGVVVGASTLVQFQIYNANGAAVLGAAWAPLALTVAGLALRAKAGAPPLWLAALLCTGTVAVYTEVLPFLAPPLAVYAVWCFGRRPLAGLAAITRFAVLCVALSPYVWVRAVRSLLLLAGVPNASGRSLWVNESLSDSIKRLLGVGWPDVPLDVGNPVVRSVFDIGGVVLPVALVIGLLGVLRWLEVRVLFVATAIWIPALLMWMYDGGRYYAFDRAIATMGPLLIFLACVGWAGLARPRAVRRDVSQGPAARETTSVTEPSRAFVAVSGASVVFLALMAVATNAMGSALFLKRAQAGFLPLNGDYVEAAMWVDEFGEAQGDGVSVASADFWQQLWLTYSLRDDRSVDWVSLDPSMLRVRAHTDGVLGRWLLLDVGVVAEVEPASVVRANAKFRLVDLEAAPAVVGVPCCQSSGEWYSPEQIRGETVRRMTNNGGLTVVHSNDSDDVVELLLRPQSALEPLQVEATPVDGVGGTASRVVLPEAGVLAIEVPGRLSRWTLVSGQPPESVRGGPVYSLILEGMRP